MIKRKLVYTLKATYIEKPSLFLLRMVVQVRSRLNVNIGQFGS